MSPAAVAAARRGVPQCAPRNKAPGPPAAQSDTMRSLMFALIATLALPGAFAADAPPTEQSIRELLQVMQAHNMIDSMMKQVDSTLEPVLKQAMGNQHLNERQRQIADDARGKIQAL